MLMFHFRGGLKGGGRRAFGFVSINRPASGAHPLSQAFLYTNRRSLGFSLSKQGDGINPSSLAALFREKLLDATLLLFL